MLDRRHSMPGEALQCFLFRHMPLAVRELWVAFKSGYNPVKPDYKLPVHLPPVTTIRAISFINPLRIGNTL